MFSFTEVVTLVETGTVVAADKTGMDEAVVVVNCFGGTVIDLPVIGFDSARGNLSKSLQSKAFGSSVTRCVTVLHSSPAPQGFIMILFFPKAEVSSVKTGIVITIVGTGFRFPTGV